MTSIKDFFKPKDRKVDAFSDDHVPFRKAGPKSASPASPQKLAVEDEIDHAVFEEAVKIADSMSSQAARMMENTGSPPVFRKPTYGAYLKRRATSPAAPGGKAIPSGNPNSLLGLTFVFTGELSSIARDAAQDLVKGLGGRVTGAPSRKTDYVVVGEAAGESKLARVKELGLNVLDEDQFFELVRSSPGQSEPLGPGDEQSTRPPKRSRTEDTGCAAGPPSSDLWTMKYAPTDSSQLIGNHSVYEKLLAWLNGFASKDEKWRAALLSGPPGIGKTSMAHLAAKEAGLDVLEFNASDCRNKKTLQDTVKEVINNTAIDKSPFFTSKPRERLSLARQVIIMDEVDGMSSGDRGGMAELIQLIKKTRTPIICCCNDRSSPKVRNLANYCVDLRFRRPDARQVVPRINEICAKEGLHLQPNVIDELVTGTHGDIRQLLNILSTYRLSGASTMSFDQSKQMYIMTHMTCRHGKDMDEGPFGAAYKLLGPQYDRMSMAGRIDTYFVDSSLVPLMVHENYLRAKANGRRPTIAKAQPSFLDLAAAAADAISLSEKVESLIRGSNQEWSLAPLHGFMSCVLPCYFVHGSLSGQVSFPGWFGHNSRSGKISRLLREISHHTFAELHATAQDIRLFHGESLADGVLEPLQSSNVDAAIAFMDKMLLCRDDVDSLIEIFGKAGEWAKIPTSSKSAFTRRYNSTTHRLPYAIGGAATAGKTIRVEDVDAGAEEGEEAPAEASTEEALDEDKMIKAKPLKKKTK